MAIAPPRPGGGPPAPGGQGQDNAHPGNDYFVFPLTGSIQRQADPVAQFALKNSGWQGPFTYAEAKAFGDKSQKNLHKDVPGLPNPLAGLSGVIGAIDTFFRALADPYMWRSLAWIVGGALLIIAGVMTWLKLDVL